MQQIKLVTPEGIKRFWSSCNYLDLDILFCFLKLCLDFNICNHGFYIRVFSSYQAALWGRLSSPYSLFVLTVISSPFCKYTILFTCILHCCVGLSSGTVILFLCCDIIQTICAMSFKVELWNMHPVSQKKGIVKDRAMFPNSDLCGNLFLGQSSFWLAWWKQR